MDPVIEQTIVCIFCRSIINYINGDEKTFLRHLIYEHNINFYKDLVLVLNLTDKDNLQVIITMFGDESHSEGLNNSNKVEEKIGIKSDDDDDDIQIIEGPNDEALLYESNDEVSEKECIDIMEDPNLKNPHPL